MRHTARPFLTGLLFTLVAFPACHRNRSEAQEPESEECFGARCVEEAEAAMWYKDYEKAREPLTAVCERGDGFQCYRLAELWHYGRGGPVDMGKAAKYYEASCAGDYPEGCEKRAELAREGDGDPAVELEYAMKACEGGRPLACVRAGEQINTARGVERDEAKAIEMFQKGCRLGDTDGCNGAGDLLFAQKSIDAQTRGLAAYIAACTGHSGYGCLKAGIAFHEGIGTRRDIERARQHFARACEFLENDGCLIEKELAKAGGEPIVLQFTSEVDELASGGLQAYDFTCRMTEQGPSALDMVLSRVARHKDSLDGCMKNSGAAVAVAWEFDKNRVLEVKATGRLPKKSADCVSWVMRKAKVSAIGSCKAVLLLGDSELAAKSLERRVAAEEKKAKAKEKKIVHVRASELE